MNGEKTYLGVLHYGRSEQMFVGILMRADENGAREVASTGEVPGMEKTERELVGAARIDRKFPAEGTLLPDLIEGSPRIHPRFGASIKIYVLGALSTPS
jgi:hypothetical protein